MRLTDIYGTVEDITFRTTRIRDANNQIIIIPNSKISDDYIVNTSKREKRIYSLSLNLDLSTDLEKVAILNSHIKQLLYNNEHILSDSVKVLFDTISNSGFSVIISFYTEIIDINDFLKLKEQINYNIFDLVKQENIKLAPPTCCQK